MVATPVQCVGIARPDNVTVRSCVGSSPQLRCSDFSLSVGNHFACGHCASPADLEQQYCNLLWANFVFPVSVQRSYCLCDLEIANLPWRCAGGVERCWRCRSLVAFLPLHRTAIS